MFGSSKLKEELKKSNIRYDHLKFELEKSQAIIKRQTDIMTRRMDSTYYNVKTGQGTSSDTNEYTNLKFFTQYSFQFLENLAAVDPIISKILDTLTSTIFKDDFEIICEDKEYFDKFMSIWHDLGLDEKNYDTCYGGFTFGHSFMLLDVDDGLDWDQPLDMSKIKEIKNISVINRYFFAPDPVERDFMFNPVYYYLVQQPLYEGYDFHDDKDLVKFAEEVQKLARQRVHYTRMLPYWGKKLQPYLFRTNLHFHDTYIRKIEQAVKNYHVALDNLSTIISKVPYPLAKIKNLTNLLSDPEQREAFIGAMGVKEQFRSTNNVSMFDTEEEYTLYSPSLAGFGEAIDKIERRLCFSCDIPHDVLFGEGSTGMTKGRAEKTNFERFIETEQKMKVKPKIIFFMELFEQVYNLKQPQKFDIIFGHSEKATELEESQSFSNNAGAVSALEALGYDCEDLVVHKYPQIKKDEEFGGIDNDIMIQSSMPKQLNQAEKTDSFNFKKKRNWDAVYGR